MIVAHQCYLFEYRAISTACYALVTLLVVVQGYGLDTLLLAEGGRSKEQGTHLWHDALRFASSGC